QSCVYLGVPYAASPAGAQRWRAPAPVVPWTGVKSVTKFGNMCPQVPRGGVTAVGNEDCLNLNVFSPPHRNALPVLFMIPGGGTGRGCPLCLSLGPRALRERSGRRRGLSAF